MSDTTDMPSSALISVSSAPAPQVQVHEHEETSAETGDHKTAIKSDSTALVPHPDKSPLKIDHHESKPFPFTRLPAELRNRVYRYVLSSKGQIHSYWFRKPTNPNFAAILQVSRLTNAEATVILYHENTIRFMARTLRVPFADEYPSSMIDIPSRCVPFLKQIVFSPPAYEHNIMREITNVISQLATAAPNIDRIILTHRYLKDCVNILFWDPPWVNLFTALFESIAEHRSLKELILIYGPQHGEHSTMRAIEPQSFPCHKDVQRVVERIPGFVRARVDAGSPVIMIPFAMNGTDPAEVCRRLRLPPGQWRAAPVPQHHG